MFFYDVLWLYYFHKIAGTLGSNSISLEYLLYTMFSTVKLFKEKKKKSTIENENKTKQTNQNKTPNVKVRDSAN